MFFVLDKRLFKRSEFVCLTGDFSLVCLIVCFGLSHRTLYINALDRFPRNPKANLSLSYKDFSLNGPSRVWLTLEDRNLGINESDIELEELHVYGGAQIAFIKPLATDKLVSIVIGKSLYCYYKASYLIS